MLKGDLMKYNASHDHNGKKYHKNLRRLYKVTDLASLKMAKLLKSYVFYGLNNNIIFKLIAIHIMSMY